METRVRPGGRRISLASPHDPNFSLGWTGGAALTAGLGLGARDYKDVVFAVEIGAANVTAPANPEPHTVLTLLLLGAAVRYFRKKLSGTVEASPSMSGCEGSSPAAILAALHCEAAWFFWNREATRLRAKASMEAASALLEQGKAAEASVLLEATKTPAENDPLHEEWAKFTLARSAQLSGNPVRFAELLGRPSEGEKESSALRLLRAEATWEANQGPEGVAILQELLGDPEAGYRAAFLLCLYHLDHGEAEAARAVLSKTRSLRIQFRAKNWKRAFVCWRTDQSN